MRSSHKCNAQGAVQFPRKIINSNFLMHIKLHLNCKLHYDMFLDKWHFSVDDDSISNKFYFNL